MTHVPPRRRRWTGDWIDVKDAQPGKPEATETDPKIRKLLGPKGEVLRTFSDRPPTGFHQGERGRP
jgi:hypothetical protein